MAAVEGLSMLRVSDGLLLAGGVCVRIINSNTKRRTTPGTAFKIAMSKSEETLLGASWCGSGGKVGRVAREPRAAFN